MTREPNFDLEHPNEGEIPGINEAANFFFFDQEAKVTYVFVGFDKPLSLREKMANIERYRRPPVTSVVEGEGVRIALYRDYRTVAIHRLAAEKDASSKGS